MKNQHSVNRCDCTSYQSHLFTRSEIISNYDTRASYPFTFLQNQIPCHTSLLSSSSPSQSASTSPLLTGTRNPVTARVPQAVSNATLVLELLHRHLRRRNRHTCRVRRHHRMGLALHAGPDETANYRRQRSGLSAHLRLALRALVLLGRQ